MKKRNSSRYDYRYGIEPAKGVPRACQPRAGGPPLLFATDVRMTVLVTLAQAGGPLRVKNLWRHIKRKNVGCIHGLVERGLVVRWYLSPSEVYVALDPAHPAAEELRTLLLRIAQLYNFPPLIQSPEDAAGGEPPHRKSRRRDVRWTFGEPIGTLTLLLLYFIGEANGATLSRCTPLLEVTSTRGILYKFRAFGILESRRLVEGKSRGIAFRFNAKCPFYVELARVVDALDRAMPHYRIVADRQMLSALPKKRDVREGRRSVNRWKW